MIEPFRTVLLDPPWPERGGGKIKRGADRHYETLTVKQIPGVPGGLWVMGELGFRYVTNIAWPKQRASLGQYFRGRHELLLLFGVRGKGKHPSVYSDRRDLTTVLEGERSRIHSRKPQEVWDLIEARSNGPYLELFADLGAPLRPGWARRGRARRGTGDAVPARAIRAH